LATLPTPYVTCTTGMPQLNTTPYCRLWPAQLFTIFQHYLINGTIFGKKRVIERKMSVLIFSTNFV